MKNVLLFTALNACEPNLKQAPEVPLTSVCKDFPVREADGQYSGHVALTEQASLNRVEAVLRALQAQQALVECHVMEEGRVNPEDSSASSLTSVVLKDSSTWSRDHVLSRFSLVDGSSTISCSQITAPCLNSKDPSCSGFTDDRSAFLLSVTCTQPH